ncbi:MAG TPA: hypothetical protein VIV57_15145 [Anaeromyxobacter sp.]
MKGRGVVPTIDPMLRQKRTGRAARLAAALVAVTLTGAPRVLALHAPVEGHRCSCRAGPQGHRECECAICRKAAALSARASDERQPPCHRLAARKAPAGSGAGGSTDVPCLERTCGGEGPLATTVAGVEPFCLPAGRLPAMARSPEARPVLAAVARERPLEPETPPPRAA